MTIDEISKILDDCGNKRKCAECIFGYGIPTENCRTKIVIAMGEECRKIAHEMGDDGK